MSEKCVALLGRRDTPTDGVEEYCRYLSLAMRPHHFDLEILRVDWAEKGWSTALGELQEWAQAWRGQWALLQYTALAWSRRGFPLRFLRVLRELRRAGTRIAVVYHDAEAYAGTRVVDNIRRAAQRYTLRRALLACDLAVFTLPPGKVAWLPPKAGRIEFIPVGANLPLDTFRQANQELHEPPAIAVFGITGGEAGHAETRAILDAVTFAAKRVGALRLEIFGRDAESQDAFFREALRNLPVQLRISGVLPAEQIARKLADSDVLLFFRGSISSRRGSAIAGIASGLPVIAYGGPETAAPITEAGVVLVRPGNTLGAGEALVKVLADRQYRESLMAMSRAAYEEHFSWPAIAARYAQALRHRF